MLNLMTGKAFADAPTMTRGGFLRGILASGIAPTIALGAASLAGNAGAAVGRGFMRGVGARMAAAGWESLPYDEELVWITSSGTQYIDTGVTPSKYNIQEFGLYQNDESVPFGCKNFTMVANYWRYFMPSGFGWGQPKGYHDWLVDASNETILIDGKIKGSVGKTDASGSLWFFGRSDTGVKGSVSISYFREKTHELIYVYNFVPVLKNGVPCMYDRVSGGFYYNQVAGHQLGYKRKDGTVVDPT